MRTLIERLGLPGLVALLVVLNFTFATAQTLPVPEGAVLLTVDGDITVTNTAGAALFDREMLEEIGLSSMRTSTIWTQGVVHFEGVMLHEILERLGVKAGTLTLHAANEYSTQIAVADIKPDAPLIAFRRDGKNMSLREKGPLWVMFPFDTHPEYRSDIAYSLSVWQLVRITVKK